MPAAIKKPYRKWFRKMCTNSNIKPQTRTFGKGWKRDTEHINATSRCFQTYISLEPERASEII